MTEFEHFELSDGERMHPLWVRLSAHFKEQLTVLRARNDQTLTELETATLRGQIRFLKAAIALGADRPSTGD